MAHQNLPREIEVYEIGARRLYVKTGIRNFAISEADVTPEELVAIAEHIAARQAIVSDTQVGVAFVPDPDPEGNEDTGFSALLGGAQSEAVNVAAVNQLKA